MPRPSQNSYRAELGYTEQAMTRPDKGETARNRIRRLLNLDAPETPQERAQAQTQETPANPTPKVRIVRKRDPWGYMALATGVAQRHNTENRE